MPIDAEKRGRLAPKRVEYAIDALTQLGYEVSQINDHELNIEFKGSVITIFPYTGWHSGKTIKDGRGIDNLIEKLKQP